MFGRLLHAIFSILTMTVIVVFAIANRADVSVTYSPVHTPVTMPLFAVILFAALAGFLIGVTLQWLWGYEKRREVRTQRKIITGLQKDLNAAQAAAEEMRNPAQNSDTGTQQSGSISRFLPR